MFSAVASIMLSVDPAMVVSCTQVSSVLVAENRSERATPQGVEIAGDYL
jgi:hypothetical protein